MQVKGHSDICLMCQLQYLCILLRETTNALIVDDRSSFSAGTCVYFSTCCIKKTNNYSTFTTTQASNIIMLDFMNV